MHTRGERPARLIRAPLSAALLTVAAFVFAGCGSLFSGGGSGGGGGGSEGGGKVFNDRIEGDIADINSTTTTDSYSFGVITNVNEGLYRLDENNEPEPAMAEDVQINQDETEYTFTLRDGIEWSNGDPVTSEDFKYAWLRAMDPETAGDYAYILTDFIEGGEAFNTGDGSAEDVAIRTPDERTLEVSLNNPSPFFLGLTGFVTYMPLNQGFVEQQGDDFATSPDTMLYNGPYEMTKFGASEGVTFQKRSGYWDAANVDVDTVDARVIKESETALQLYESGDLDVNRLTSSEQVNEFRDTPEFEQRTEFGTNFMYFNNSEGATQNENIRKALQLGFDRQQLTDDVLNDGSVPANGFVPEGMASGVEGGGTFREAAGDTLPESDPEEARRYWDRGVEELGEEPNITLTVSDQDPSGDIGTFLQSELEANLGANIEVQVQPFDALLERGAEGDFQFWNLSWYADFDDPINYLDLWTTDGGQNDANYSNKEYDRLVDGALEEQDPDRRLEMLIEAEKILMDEAGIAPTLYWGFSWLISEDVENYVTPPYGSPNNYKVLKMNG